MVEENIRAKYGIPEKDMAFKTNEKTDKLFPDARDDYDSIMDNPINLTLTTFEKEFIKNERIAYDHFLSLQEEIEKFSNLVKEYPHYELLDIIKIFKDILFRYKLWATQMRQSILLAESKFKEASDIVNTKYYPQKEFENLRLDVLQTIEDLKRKGDILEVRRYGDSNVIPIPAEMKEKYSLGKKIVIRVLEEN
jgi:hypothetical protein